MFDTTDFLLCDFGRFLPKPVDRINVDSIIRMMFERRKQETAVVKDIILGISMISVRNKR